MGEGGHEEDGGVGEEGLQDATVPAEGEAKEQAREEHGGRYYCCHLHFLFSWYTNAKWRGQRKAFPKKREKAAKMDRNLGATESQMDQN